VAFSRALVTAGAFLVVAAALAAAPSTTQATASPSLDCAQLRKVVENWEAKAATPEADIHVQGDVQHIEEEGEIRHLTLCNVPNPRLLCVARAAEDRQVGDVLIVSGQPSLRGHDLVVIESCIHQVP